MNVLTSGKLMATFGAVYVVYSVYLYKTRRTRLLINSLLAVMLSALGFAVFSLCCIIKGIREFNNSKEPFYELQRELEEVKSELEKLGFSFSEFDIDLNSNEDGG